MATIMPRVVRRGNQFYFRVAVPLALVDRIGQRELKVSLRTCSPSEAKCRGRVLSNAIDVLFARLIRMTKLTQEQVRERVRAYFQDALNWCQEQALFIPTDKALDVEAEVASLGAYEQDLRKQLATLAYPPSVEEEAQKILSIDGAAKVVADHDLMLSACSGIMRAQVERARILGAMLSGRYEDTTPRDPMFAGMQPTGYPPIPGEAAAPTAGPLSLSLASGRYCQFHAVSWVKKTAADQERVFALACTVIGGSKLVKSLDIDDVKAVRDALAGLPPNYMKAKANQGANVLDIIATNKGGPALAVKTQDKYFSMFRSFLIWASNEGYIDKVPGAGVKVSGVGKKSPAENRQPYSVEQLKMIFSSPLYTGHDGLSGRTHPGPHILRDGKFWVPLIALYSGMRMGEIVQLMAADLREEQGIWFFDVTKGEDKKLKTASSQRRVPVHPLLLELGLLKLKGKSKRLFPDIEPGKDGYFSHNFSKWWGRYGKQIGFAKPKTAFHSFRHNFVDALRAIEAPQYVNMALVGHSNTSVHGGYGSGATLASLKGAVDKVSYPLDFNQLRE